MTQRNTAWVNPQDAEAYKNRALSYSFLGKDAEARQDVDRAVELGVNRTDLERKIEELKKRRY